MKQIDIGYDNLLGSKYELYRLNFSELKTLATSWYGKTDFKKFDRRKVNYEDQDKEVKIMKRAGIITNYFYAYLEDSKYYLLDGFNRLFTEYGRISEDTPVYLKVLTSRLHDYELMRVMLYLNLWKLRSGSGRGFRTDDFFDRGMRLFLYKKFGIEIYCYGEEYSERKRDNTDFEVLEKYFTRESYDGGMHEYDFKELIVLIANERVIGDLKEICDSNNYLKKPFNNYDDYLNGFIMMLARRRLLGDMAEYKFKIFLEMLYVNKKYFEKLQKMSWTDATRKSIFKFYSEIEKRLS